MEPIVDARDQLGESPLWSPRAQCLFWLDLLGCRLHRWTPDDEDVVVDLGGSAPLGALVPHREPGLLVLARAGGVVELDPSTGDQRVLADPLADLPHLYLNDAKTDRAGRLWLTTADVTGTEPRAVLLRADAAGVHVAHRGFAQGNGPAVSPDGSRLYLSESLTGRVLVHALADDGTLGDGRVLVALDGEEGVPDGLTVDRDGNLWVAHWGGGRVTCWSPDGVLLETLPVPAPHVTSVAFGGPDLDLLVVTTARADLDDDALRRWPASGSLFAARPGATGIAETPWTGLGPG